MTFEQSLSERLEVRRKQFRYRRRRVLTSAQGSEITVDGKRLLNFCSNDYLGLADHPSVKQAFADAVQRFGGGAGASHLVCGHSQEHHRLEEELAAWTGRERALVFSSGYMANLGVINTLVAKGDAVFEDKLNHASLLDGGLISGARFKRYRHNDWAHCDQLLADSEGRLKLIVTDGIFSMDGDMAPLTPLTQVAKKHSAWLMVDDAHGLGWLGDSGAGCADAQGLDQNALPVLMGTFGKALGTAGAFVAGSELLIESLIQFARTYIYTTALPPALAAATRQSLKLVQEEDWRRNHLQSLIQQFREGAKALGIPLAPSISPIQPLIVGSDRRAMALADALYEQGFWVSPIRPPTVPEGSARLRFTLSASHTQSHVQKLLSALERCDVLREERE